MSKKLEEIIKVAKDLSLEERAELAGTLLLSLDEPSESEVERLWFFLFITTSSSFESSVITHILI